jgi:hypothetical protein
MPVIEFKKDCLNDIEMPITVRIGLKLKAFNEKRNVEDISAKEISLAIKKYKSCLNYRDKICHWCLNKLC